MRLERGEAVRARALAFQGVDFVFVRGAGKEALGRRVRLPADLLGAGNGPNLARICSHRCNDESGAVGDESGEGCQGCLRTAHTPDRPVDGGRDVPVADVEARAAHIKPRAMLGADDVRNGPALCLDHHWAWDQGKASRARGGDAPHALAWHRPVTLTRHRMGVRRRSGVAVGAKKGATLALMREAAPLPTTRSPACCLARDHWACVS